MNRKRRFGLLLAVVLLLAAVLIGPRLRGRGPILAALWSELAGGGNHPGQVLHCGVLAVRARHNLDVIQRAAHYAALLGFHTNAFVHIAQVAARADAECPRLGDVLDLAVMRTSETLRVLELADRACDLEDPFARRAWERDYAALRAGAEYPSVETALAALAGSPED